LVQPVGSVVFGLPIGVNYLTTDEKILRQRSLDYTEVVVCRGRKRRVFVFAESGCLLKIVAGSGLSGVSVEDEEGDGDGKNSEEDDSDDRF
jgi:hypothetical protein